jgi:alkylation response protein AidB-like acyl-CoA dehydrogenase
MDFKISEEQELLVTSLKELLDKEAPPEKVIEWDENHQFPTKLWETLAMNGFFGLGIPEEYGGTPADILTQCLVGETISYYVDSFPYGLSSVGVHNVLMFGTDEQKKKFLGAFLETGYPIVALGISEPQAGSDAAAIKTTYQRNEKGWLINGQKIYCTASDIAQYIMLVTRNPEIENPYKGMTVFLLPTDAPGVRINPLRKIGQWGMNTNEVFIDNVQLPEDSILGTENNGWMQLMANFEIERLIGATMFIGPAQAALEDAARYANQRVQFGKPIASFQAIQHKIADMALKVENMRNLIYKTAWMMDNGLPVRYEAAMAKLYCARAGFEVCDDGMQILGGVGYTMDHRMQRLWRNIRVGRLAAGSDEIMYNIIGPQILKKYKS